MITRPALTQIADDTYQLRLPLPFALNHIQVYLLRGSNGWTIVDCGINYEPARKVWQDAFTELNFGFADIDKIVLTHVHPDHFGLAGWLQKGASEAGKDVTIYLSPRENQQVLDVWQSDRDKNFGAWLKYNGLPDDFANQVNNSLGSTLEMTYPHPTGFAHIQPDSDVQLGNRTFQTTLAPGHSDGQLIFYDPEDKLLLSGDHVLMRITPNIGLWEDSDPNPLGAYIESLSGLQSREVRLALPGHRRLIEDWSGRIAELLSHHDHRLEVVVNAMEKDAHTPYEVAQHIFEVERFTPHEWRFAIAETLSHLELLRVRGIVQQDTDTQSFSLA
ncbi:MAG: MBL fold metallo-hydrolase [Chloroflexota bacterium]